MGRNIFPEKKEVTRQVEIVKIAGANYMTQSFISDKSYQEIPL
jgi:hypothetical protein